MKKPIVLALILALALVLCACGETAVIEKEVRVEIPVIPEEYLKYQELLDTLEAGRYDEARSLVEQMKPAPEVPPVVEVEITADNFLDYFEYVEIPEYGLEIQYLSSGEPAAIFAASGYFLKDGYQVHPEHKSDNNVTADVKYTCWFLDSDSMVIDFDARTYTLTYPLDTDYYQTQEEEGTLRAFYSEEQLHLILTRRTALLNDYVNYIPVVIDPVELVSASGTLYLAG